MIKLVGTLVGKAGCHAQGYHYQVHQGTEELDRVDSSYENRRHIGHT